MSTHKLSIIFIFGNVMTTKTIKTILFASLIAAMILPFSGMNYAEADSANAEFKAKKDKLKADKESFKDELAKTTDSKKKEKLGKILDRITLFEELEDLLVGELDVKTQEKIQKIYNKLKASYSEDENGLSLLPPPTLTAFADSFIPVAYATSSDAIATSVQYRGDCNHGQYGYLYATYTAYADWTQFDQTWNYPTIIYDATGNCATWDFEDNWSTVFGYKVYCPYSTQFLTASYWCQAGEGDYVTVWSNADYDGPLNPPAPQSFTGLPEVASKTL